MAQTQTSLQCPKWQFGKCGLARWRLQLGRPPGPRNPSPPELTPGLCLVSNVNLSDSREFALGLRILMAAAVVAAVRLRLVAVTKSISSSGSAPATRTFKSGVSGGVRRFSLPLEGKFQNKIPFSFWDGGFE